ncbi:unnamed protein product [Paramecium octaurelia]|uniref:Uncharacterized protein n=1 Tax=Paramecium octaurelia TaxID=43137 RepID=A0A8S1SZI7_PAROT|nr:unnamed protein product [Paramecium octaurelia]
MKLKRLSSMIINQLHKMYKVELQQENKRIAQLYEAGDLEIEVYGEGLRKWLRYR